MVMSAATATTTTNAMMMTAADDDEDATTQLKMVIKKEIAAAAEPEAVKLLKQERKCDERNSRFIVGSLTKLIRFVRVCRSVGRSVRSIGRVYM